MKRRLTLFLATVSFLFLWTGTIVAQPAVTGTVVSQDDGEPIVGARVMLKDTQIGTVTDTNGKFSLTHLPSTARILQVSYLGMQTQELPIKPNMQIAMVSDQKMLDEVMVVAFGTAKKSAFTGSAKVVGAEELEQTQTSVITNALAGYVPGVQLTSNDGAPGSTSTIRVRGFSSINAKNDPLIILDGAPYPGDLSNINPSDVESITVLKDASSNALYGARGANGVIMITTKSASGNGGASVTFDAKWGANSRALRHYKTISNPAQYYEMHYSALNQYYLNQGMSEQQAWQMANQNLCGDVGSGGLGYNVYTVPDGQYLIGTNGKLNPAATLGRVVSYNGEEYLVTPDNWEDAGTRTGLRQEYNISVNNATDKSTFLASLGYLGTEGLTYGSDLKRLTGRLKADSQIKRWLKVGANVSYSRYDTNVMDPRYNGASNSTGNIWAFTTRLAPIYPAYIRNADGSVKIDANGIGMMDYGDGTNAGYARPSLSNANPIMDNRLNTMNYEGNSSTGNMFANFYIVPGLTLTVNGSYDLDETRETMVYNPYYGQYDSTGGTVEKVHLRVYDYNLQQLLSYVTTIKRVHNLDIMLGHEYYDKRYAYLSASASNMFSQDNKELAGAVVDGQTAYSYKTRVNNEGYFGRLQYNYDERYFASFSLRRDASSKFAPSHRWGTFWSLGAAWLIDKEKWFTAPWVDELKVKASYGVQGNDNIDYFLYTDQFLISNSGGNVGTSFYSKGTEDITWETNGNLNVGTEFSFLDHRLTGSLEYYRRMTTDMLFKYSVAPSLGYDNYWKNVGDMYNSGIELDLGANLIRRRNLSWDVRLNVSTLKNRITRLHDDLKSAVRYDSKGNEYRGFDSENFFIAEGVSIYTWRLKDYAGVADDGQSMWYKNVTDEDGNITGRETTTSWSDADYYVTRESPVPKAFGGFGTTLRAYGVDFTINFSYQLGGKQLDYTYMQLMGSPTSSYSGYNFHADLLKAWSETNTGSDIPRFVWGDLYSSAASTRFLTSSRYLNIENVNVGYTFPAKAMAKARINSLRVYLACENLFFWSARRGFDPRQSYSTYITGAYYSPMRTVSGGITLKF